MLAAQLQLRNCIQLIGVRNLTIDRAAVLVLNKMKLLNLQAFNVSPVNFRICR